ncbi:MAG: DHH family phosphoesterase, partial [Methylococcales bacterium]|nr:DHH family phosphoesterase [Methylococcales bacterium]
MYHQGVKKNIVPRPAGKKSHLKDIDPLLNKIFSTRGVTENEQLERTLARLPSPWLLSGMEAMVEHLITAIQQQQKITIVADFDADGATSCVVAMKGLNLLGAKHVSYVVPNRFEYGYGLTPEIVELVKQQKPDVIITVDNGISSIDGVKVAKDFGIKVLITDHHLP